MLFKVWRYSDKPHNNTKREDSKVYLLFVFVLELVLFEVIVGAGRKPQRIAQGLRKIRFYLLFVLVIVCADLVLER